MAGVISDIKETPKGFSFRFGEHKRIVSVISDGRPSWLVDGYCILIDFGLKTVEILGST